MERKLARLRREITEVKDQVQRQDATTKQTSDSNQVDHQEVDNLERVLDSIGRARLENNKTASERMTQLLSSPPKPRSKQSNNESGAPGGKAEQSSQGEESDALLYHNTTKLSMISVFDERLTLLEEALGVDALPLPTQEPNPPKSLLPTLDSLHRQISTLSTASDLALDKVKGRIRELSLEAESLEKRRSEAKQALETTGAGRIQSSLVAANGDSKNDDAQDAEQTAKVNALYGTLGTIESLAPLLPSVLDRLRSLRDLHAEGASAIQNLVQVEGRQEDMKQELQAWRKGVEKVEQAIQESRETLKGNTDVVETWVKELEGRVKIFE